MDTTEDAVRFVTNSELQAAKDCRRRWYLTYVRGLARKREDRTGPLPLGTRVHRGLEGMYVDDGDALAAYDETTAAGRVTLDPDVDDVALFEKEATLGRVMLEGYLEWLAETGVDANLEVIGAEQALAASLEMTDHRGRPVHLLGKLDLRVRRAIDGAVLFLDHKTAQAFARVFAWLPLNEQFLTYQLLERLHLVQSGEDRPPTVGAFVNVLRKVGRGKTAKPPFYRREEVYHNDSELRNFWHRVRAEVADLVEWERRIEAGEDHRLVAYPRPSHDCTWRCPFFLVCAMFDDGDGSRAEALLADEYVVRDPLLRYRDEHRHPDVDGERGEEPGE